MAVTVYNKLVRDRIPEIIESNGQQCACETLEGKRYLEMLDAKLNEELAEYQQSKSLEELADLLEVIRAGGFTNGGLNFDAKTRRPSNTPEDIAQAYIAGMDSFALGYKIARKIVADGRIDEFVKQRYASYQSGIGKKILDKTATIDELEKYALGLGDVTTNISGKQEYLEDVLNAVMFG